MTCCVGITCGLPVRWAGWVYYLGFFVVTVVSWVLRDYGGSALDFGAAKGCLAEGLCGDLAVLRLSLGSLMFFALMLLLTLGVTALDSPRLALHVGFWPLKFLVWGGLIGSTFAMPSSVFTGYQQGARVLSAFFILVQLVILLDCVYLANEWLLERPGWAPVLVGVTALLIAASITGLAFLYKYWAPHASCHLNIFFVTWTLVLFLGYAALSVSPLRVESAGLMTSAATFAYCTYYTWSALTSEPGGDCTPQGRGGAEAIRIISFVLALLVVGVSTTTSGLSSSSFSLAGATKPEDGEGESELPYRPDFFHLTFLLASAYVAMVLIGWGMGAGEGAFAYDKGWPSVWAKIGSTWACALLYTWSLVAHRVLAWREF